METKPVRFIPHGLNSPEVQARMAHDNAVERMERINERLAPRWDEFKSRINALVRNQRSADYCIPAFWAVIDDVAQLASEDTACKAGCSHCCNLQVLITQDEADVIGKRIGRPAVKLTGKSRGRKDVEKFDWGYHNPCTFLVNDQCSIYENRPLPCRTQLNVDIDALMCELTPPESKRVPYMNFSQFTHAFLIMLGVPKRAPKLGDIREFFPKVKP